jgi:hypothetical protein
MSNLSGISNFGWVSIILIILILAGVIIAICVMWKDRNIKTKYFESDIVKEHQETQRELLMSEGKDQLENQCQVAKNILKELRIKIYETGVKKFNIKGKQELDILELLTYRIVDRLNYDVKNDLTRNHITHKTDYELEEYTRAKSRGYYSMIKDRLYTQNDYLPNYNLPILMEQISPMEVEAIFKDVYFSARRIANGMIEKSNAEVK